MGRLVEWKLEPINTTVSRTKVLDGWIVLYKEGVSSAMAFVKDVYHDWDVLAEALPPSPAKPEAVIPTKIEIKPLDASKSAWVSTSLPPVIAPHLGAPIKPALKPKVNGRIKGEGVPESKL